MHEPDALQIGYATNATVLDGPPAIRGGLGKHARTAPSHAVVARRATEA